MTNANSIFEPFELPCGTILKNRIIKAAMSDSLGDGRGDATAAQINLYRRWAEGGLAAAIIGEVQGDPLAAEKPGNLVLGKLTAEAEIKALASAGATAGAHLWVQLGHAGAMTHAPIGTPKGPSALNLPGLTCAALTPAEITALPQMFADTAARARKLGFGGVQIHAAHGFLLSQFLSPLFNHRTDGYGGSIANRMRLLLDTIMAVRGSVGADFPIAVKLNATDMLEGGLLEADALTVISAMDQTSIDLIDISGGTYFPGAASASDGSGGGPYFLRFAEQARARTTKPLMVTGGFKTKSQVMEALASGATDFIGLARPLILVPELPKQWHAGSDEDPVFPTFEAPPEGGITAWYTMRMTQIAEGREQNEPLSVTAAMATYEQRDELKARMWRDRFATPPQNG